jgi:hypothetical protein
MMRTGLGFGTKIKKEKDNHHTRKIKEMTYGADKTSTFNNSDNINNIPCLLVELIAKTKLKNGYINSIHTFKVYKTVIKKIKKFITVE